MTKRKTGKKRAARRAAGRGARPGRIAALAVASAATALVVFYARGGFTLLRNLLGRH